MLGLGDTPTAATTDIIDGSDASFMADVVEASKTVPVIVDFWATWCGPCIREIPYLKEVEKKYHDANIQFVSVSIDRLDDFEKWKTFIADKELGGIQLYADGDWKSSIITDYAIDGIPRFILVDPEGNIVSADAPRPSNPALVELLDGLVL